MPFKVLAIDSQDSAEDLYHEVLKGRTYLVHVANSLDEGLDSLQSCLHEAPYRLIIIDESVISEDQLDQQVILKMFGESFVLLLLNDSKILSVLKWVEPNIFVYLKPFEIEILRAKIQSVEEGANLKEQQKQRKRTTNKISPMVQKEQLYLALDNHPDHIPLTIHYLLMYLENNGVGEDDLFRVKLGLTECLINAVAHGNLDMSSLTLKGGHKNFDMWDAEILRRSQDPDYRDKRVHLHLSYDIKEGILLKIEDEGKGFDTEKMFNKEKNDGEKFNSFGRGLKMVESTSDEMKYNAKGNCLTLRYSLTPKQD